MLLHVQQLLGLALQQPTRRDAGPGGDDVGDVVGADLLLDHRLLTDGGGLGLALLRVGQLLLEGRDVAVEDLRGGTEVALALQPVGLRAQVVDAGLEVAHGVEAGLLRLPARVEGRELLGAVGEVLPQPLEPVAGGGIGLLLEGELLHLEPVDGAPELVDLHGARVDLHAQPRGRLVDEVDRLVGQLATGDVAVAEGGGRDERGVGDRHLVVRLVALLEAAQDGDGVLHRRLTDEDLLEAPLEGRVLLDVLAVLVQRGRADEAQLATGEHGLEHVPGVHRTLAARSGADDRVDLVDEGDDLAITGPDLLEHRLEALLELAAVLRAGQHGREVEAVERLVTQALGHVALDDALGQPLDDGRLADAGLADEDGVVLRAALRAPAPPAGSRRRGR